jgi:hypothetical protein
MRNTAEELRQAMQEKTDEELYLILHVHSQDYTLQALTVAREEFSHRSLDESRMSRIMEDVEKAREQGQRKLVQPEQKLKSNDNDTMAGLGCLFLLCLVGYGIYGGYESLDSSGWIPHREDTVISARIDWLVGESKECWSTTLNSDGATQLAKEVGYAMSSVSCDNGPEHNMKVTFYGRKVQTEYKVVEWRCVRNEGSFTCYQTGGQR